MIIFDVQATVKELKESNQSLQKELQDEKSNHQMTQLRAEKQEEWNRRELAQLKDELADKKKLMDTMISKELYKRDLDNVKIQNQTALVFLFAGFAFDIQNDIPIVDLFRRIFFERKTRKRRRPTRTRKSRRKSCQDFANSSRRRCRMAH